MANSVKLIRASGIYNRFDLEQSFRSGVNILHGRNGTGKTTVLHILANVLNGDFKRFAFLPFRRIQVILDDDTPVQLEHYGKGSSKFIKVEIANKVVDEFSVQEAQESLRVVPERSSMSEQMRVIEKLLAGLNPIIPVAYFPAFRTLIEAASRHDDNEQMYTAVRYSRSATQQMVISSTRFSRRFFGEFVPWINYPSPVEVGSRIANESQQALNTVANTDRELLSKAFLDIFAALSSTSIHQAEKEPESVLEGIKDLFNKLETSSLIADPMSDEEVYSKLRELVLKFNVSKGLEHLYVPVLEVYKRSLSERVRVQEIASRSIKLYLDSVNEFLEGKKLVTRRRQNYPIPSAELHFEDNTYGSIQALSSGERQIVTLIYSMTHMSEQKIVLIDEPEISLHIDWQIKLLPKMAEQMHNKQIITCTHSPTIGAEYEDCMAELKLTPSTERSMDISSNDEVEEIL